MYFRALLIWQLLIVKLVFRTDGEHFGPRAIPDDLRTDKAPLLERLDRRAASTRQQNSKILMFFVGARTNTLERLGVAVVGKSELKSRFDADVQLLLERLKTEGLGFDKGLDVIGKIDVQKPAKRGIVREGGLNCQLFWHVP